MRLPMFGKRMYVFDRVLSEECLDEFHEDITIPVGSTYIEGLIA